jgi:hypothetical protein
MMSSKNAMPYALIGIGAAWLLASHRSAGQWRQGNGDRWRATASERVEAVTERARRAADGARQKWNTALNDNPMALGMAALAAGALVGTLLPVTETENEYLGEARDTAVESARSLDPS